MNGWSEFFARTEAMLEAARAGAFERVAVCEAERRGMLALLPPPDDGERGLIAQMLDHEREIATRVEAARAHAAECLRRARQTQAGAGAYLGVAFGR